MRSLLFAAGFAAALGLALSEALAVDVVGSRCVRDALGRTSCARDVHGVAVVDKLGDVRCAPGACMRAESAEATGWDDEWICSGVSGGKVELTPDGPRCDGACRPPRATDCDQH